MKSAMNQYQLQQRANIGALTNDPDFKERLKLLLELRHNFQKVGVEWALSCSTVLFLLGIVDDFHDFDLLGSPQTIQVTEEVLNTMGEKAPKDESKARFFESDAFATYHIGRIDVDYISEFGVITFGTQYQYHFNKEENEEIPVEINGEIVEIPIAPAESQYLLYYMMEGWQPNRKFKRQLIEAYLKSEGGLRHPEILSNALTDNIPWWIKNDIRKILKN